MILGVEETQTYNSWTSSCRYCCNLRQFTEQVFYFYGDDSSINTSNGDSNESINQNMNSFLLNFINTILPSQYLNSQQNFSFLQFPALQLPITYTNACTVIANETTSQNNDMDKKFQQSEPINLSKRESSTEAPLDLSNKNQNNVYFALENQINYIKNISDYSNGLVTSTQLKPLKNYQKEIQSVLEETSEEKNNNDLSFEKVSKKVPLKIADLKLNTKIE